MVQRLQDLLRRPGQAGCWALQDEEEGGEGRGGTLVVLREGAVQAGART